MKHIKSIFTSDTFITLYFTDGESADIDVSDYSFQAMMQAFIDNMVDGYDTLKWMRYIHDLYSNIE